MSMFAAKGEGAGLVQKHTVVSVLLNSNHVKSVTGILPAEIGLFIPKV